MAKEGVMVTCRKCGRNARSDEFILDNVYRMMVCQNCVKDRRMRENVHKELAEQKAAKEAAQDNKPGDWDKEDEYLERASRRKADEMVHVQPLSDSKVKYTCPKCKYGFLYNTERKMPASCPYCSSPISKMRLG